MKVSNAARCRTLWVLMLLISFTEVKPQGYVYPSPTSSVSTTASTITTQRANNATGTPDTTTAFSGYIIEAKENSSALAEGIIAPTTENVSSSETEPSPSVDGEESSITENPNASEEPENEVSTEGSTETNGVKDDSEKMEEAPTTVESLENAETTTNADDMETTTVLSGPYPASGLRPNGRDFLYDVQDLFPGSKVVPSPSQQSSANNDLSIQTVVSRQPVNLPVRQSLIPMNQPANQADFPPTYSGPQRPYFYRSPSQNLQNIYYPQQVVYMNFPMPKFVHSYANPYSIQSAPAPHPPSMPRYNHPFSARDRAPYPPSVTNYDQGFSASEPAMQSYFVPRDNEYHPQHQFAYAVRAPPRGPVFGHEEGRRGQEARGRYYVLQPDGRMRVVHYEADARGYRPSVSYEPTITHQDYP